MIHVAGGGRGSDEATDGTAATGRPEAVWPDRLPPAPGWEAAGVVTDGLLHISGQLALGPGSVVMLDAVVRVG